MILCPYCDAENIEGADVCDQCEMPLTRPQPAGAGHGRRARPATRSHRVAAAEAADFRRARCAVGDVLKTMVDRGIGCMMIVDGDRLLGIFSERDALMRLNVDAAKMADRPVSEFMTVNPATLARATRSPSPCTG